MSETRIVEMPKGELARVEPPSIANIVHAAIESGRSPEELREIMAFAREMRAEAALAAYNHALAEFKRTCPPIVRRTENQQFKKVTRNGTTRPSRFASLADIGETIDKPLSTVGLSYDWTDADTTTEVGKMRLGCTIRHADGHVAAPKYVSFPLDTAGAGSSPQQKVGSVTKYCMRYSLTAALGLTDCDDDDDDGASGPSSGETITESQQNTINDLIIEVFADRAKFLKFMGVDKLADIPASRFDTAVAALNAKRKAKA